MQVKFHLIEKEAPKLLNIFPYGTDVYRKALRQFGAGKVLLDHSLFGTTQLTKTKGSVKSLVFQHSYLNKGSML